MKKKNLVVTGKVGVGFPLTELITGKKANKFSKYASREEYRAALFRMNHVELYEEVIRLGEAPSAEKEFCRNKCLAIFDSAQKPRNVYYQAESKQTLEDILEKNRKK